MELKYPVKNKNDYGETRYIELLHKWQDMDKYAKQKLPKVGMRVISKSDNRLGTVISEGFNEYNSSILFDGNGEEDF